MSIQKDAYEIIRRIVGDSYITDDPADCLAYRSGPGGYKNGTGYDRVMTKIPGAIAMPDLESIQKAHIELGNAEVGGAITKVPLFWRAIAKAEDKEDFWRIWLKETEESVKKFLYCSYNANWIHLRRAV